MEGTRWVDAPATPRPHPPRPLRRRPPRRRRRPSPPVAFRLRYPSLSCLTPCRWPLPPRRAARQGALRRRGHARGTTQLSPVEICHAACGVGVAWSVGSAGVEHAALIAELLDLGEEQLPDSLVSGDREVRGRRPSAYAPARHARGGSGRPAAARARSDTAPAGVG